MTRICDSRRPNTPAFEESVVQTPFAGQTIVHAPRDWVQPAPSRVRLYSCILESAFPTAETDGHVVLAYSRSLLLWSVRA